MLSDPRVSIRKFIREPADLRGGFCFELNVPFAWLLTQLGFDVHLRLSQVCFGENPGAAGTLIFTLPAHCLPVVRLNGECFIAYVGFGDFARCPLKFPCDCDPTKYFDNPASATAPAEDSFVIADQNLRAITPVETDKVGDRWRIAVPTSPVPANDAQAMRDFPLYVLRFRRVRFSMGEEWLDTQDSAAQQWGVAYRFSAKPYDPTSDAFKAAMCFVLGDANSPFNQKRIVMKGTPNGHLTLSERRLKTVEGNTVSEIAVQDMRHWRQLLQEKFGISLISSSSCKRVSTV
jgi:arylamine N-acetyltransferase